MNRLIQLSDNKKMLVPRNDIKLFLIFISNIVIITYNNNYHSIQAAMAEWLRREIRNLLGSPRAGSNPVRSVLFLINF